MSFLARMKMGSQFMSGRHSRGVTGTLVNKGERYASSAAFGFIKGYYRERSLIGGVIPVDLLAGAVCTLASAGLEIWSQGQSNIAPHLGAIGDSGMTSYFNSLGAAWGAKMSKRTVYVLNEGAAAPAALAGMQTPPASVLGELPQAVGGAYLSAEEIAHFASQR